MTIQAASAQASGTVGGAARSTLLHPLQQAFVAHGATQCGFCTPGFIMQAKTLLDANPDPTDEEIKHCLKDTYCRCTGYASILTAIKAAAEQMRTGHLPLPQLPETVEPLEAVGQPLPRPDAIAKVTGQALYTDDYLFAGMLHGATLRSAASPRPHPGDRHQRGAGPARRARRADLRRCARRPAPRPGGERLAGLCRRPLSRRAMWATRIALVVADTQ